MGVAMLWGTTFLIVHLALNFSGPLFFVGVRFLVAGLASVVVFRKALKGLNWYEVGAGALIGLTIALGYVLQTIGLQTITSSQSAFITALYVPLVPVLQWVILRKAPHAMSWVGVVLAFSGLVLLSGAQAGALKLTPGEVITVISTVAIAAEIVLISRFAAKVNSQRATVVQLWVAGLLALLGMPIFGESIPTFHWGWAAAAIGLGLASALIQVTINWAQEAVAPTRATLIYAGEPVWGGVFGSFAGDRMPEGGLVGAAMVIAGVLVSELRLGKKKRAPSESPEALCPATSG